MAVVMVVMVIVVVVGGGTMNVRTLEIRLSLLGVHIQKICVDRIILHVNPLLTSLRIAIGWETKNFFRKRIGEIRCECNHV